MDLLSRLTNQQTYDEYMDLLFKMYYTFNDNRKNISEHFEKSITVIGGMLYFVLFREARRLKMDFSSFEYLNDFIRYRSIDLDASYFIPVDFENDISLNDVDDMFNTIVAMNCDVVGRVSDLLRIDDVKCKTTLNRLRDGCLELRPSLVVLEQPDSNYRHVQERISDDDDRRDVQPQHVLEQRVVEQHVFETMIIFSNESRIEDDVVYDFKCMERAFVGQNIVSSISQQVYPNERFWRDIENIYTKSRKEIYSEIGRMFEKDPVLIRKFNQGYYRAIMVRFVLEKTLAETLAKTSVETSSIDVQNTDCRIVDLKNLQDTILPTNIVLSNLLFFLQGNLVRKLALDIANRAHKLRILIPKTYELAKIEHVFIFLDLCLDLWKIFNVEIYNSTSEFESV